ncbi:hypothetical protein MXB_183, partial [Myxobolus squamalis]
MSPPIGKQSRIAYLSYFDYPIPDLSEQYLLMQYYFEGDYEKISVTKYLILPSYMVDLTGEKCNLIGTTWKGFESQGYKNGGYGCKQQKNFCIENQPYKVPVDHSFECTDEMCLRSLILKESYIRIINSNKIIIKPLKPLR